MIATLYVAWRIPHQIMINQRYAELLQEWRSVEMGDAIHSIWDFFVNDCDSRVENIEEQYIRLHQLQFRTVGDSDIEQIKRTYIANGKEDYRPFIRRKIRHFGYRSIAPQDTLNFKRRLIDHYFWLMADLCFNPAYPVKMRNIIRRKIQGLDFSQSERDLLYIVHHMNNAQRRCRIKPTGDYRNTPDYESPQFDTTSPMGRYRQKLYEDARYWGISISAN
jgi:hypothetical protein